ncbi:MAG: hypothetical protein ACKJSK_09490 [Roseibacillus sp.]
MNRWAQVILVWVMGWAIGSSMVGAETYHRMALGDLDFEKG